MTAKETASDALFLAICFALLIEELRGTGFSSGGLLQSIDAISFLTVSVIFPLSVGFALGAIRDSSVFRVMGWVALVVGNFTIIASSMLQPVGFTLAVQIVAGTGLVLGLLIGFFLPRFFGITMNNGGRLGVVGVTIATYVLAIVEFLIRALLGFSTAIQGSIAMLSIFTLFLWPVLVLALFFSSILKTSISVPTKQTVPSQFATEHPRFYALWRSQRRNVGINGIEVITLSFDFRKKGWTASSLFMSTAFFVSFVIFALLFHPPYWVGILAVTSVADGFALLAIISNLALKPEAKNTR